jgi:hypothetical protein
MMPLNPILVIEIVARHPRAIGWLFFSFSRLL